jgi:hypothetical protein
LNRAGQRAAKGCGIRLQLIPAFKKQDISAMQRFKNARLVTSAHRDLMAI